MPETVRAAPEEVATASCARLRRAIHAGFFPQTEYVLHGEYRHVCNRHHGVADQFPRLPEVHLINPWLLGEECKPIIVCDANVALHFEPILISEKRAHLGLLGMQACPPFFWRA